jgi:hypothetical protein
MAALVLSSMDAADQSRYSDRLIELNLALGNETDAAAAAVETALVDQKRGDYKVSHCESFSMQRSNHVCAHEVGTDLYCMLCDVMDSASARLAITFCTLRHCMCAEQQAAHELPVAPS